MIRPSPMREGGHRPEVLAIDNNIVAPLIFKQLSLLCLCFFFWVDFCWEWRERYATLYVGISKPNHLQDGGGAAWYVIGGKWCFMMTDENSSQSKNNLLLLLTKLLQKQRLMEDVVWQ